MKLVITKEFGNIPTIRDTETSFTAKLNGNNADNMAALFRAAPELLKACEDMQFSFDEIEKKEGYSKALLEFIKAKKTARRAIISIKKHDPSCRGICKCVTAPMGDHGLEGYILGETYHYEKKHLCLTGKLLFNVNIGEDFGLMSPTVFFKYFTVAGVKDAKM